MPVSATLRPPHRAGAFFFGAVTYAALLLAFWLTARMFALESRIGGHMPSTFASFALLLAPYWAFGFGAAERLRSWLRMPSWRVMAPGLLLVPYLFFALPRGEFRPGMAAVLFAIPVGIAALFEFLLPPDSGLCWQDAVVLAAVGLPVEFRWLQGAWPHPGLAALPKFLLVDAVLYAFLVVRRLEGVGYDFRLRGRDLLVGLREWLFFAPIAIALGLALKFISFHAHVPHPANVSAAWLITFFFVAMPEELFFRGLLQNLLEVRVGRVRALLIAATIFGLSHFNKPMPFNWRYVLLATIAGIFYGRAWRDRRRLFCSGITHATVDVVWSMWFR
jgi:uncharacterized protein